MFFENEFTGSLSFGRLLLVLIIGLAPMAVTILVKWVLYGRSFAEGAVSAAREKHRTLAIEGTLEEFAVALANEIENFTRPRQRITVEAFRRLEAEKELARTRRFGWRSLLAGLVFLSLAIGLVQIVKRSLPAGNFASVIEIGLAILAWVALWRPAEVLLYEWYPFRRDARVFGQLERAEIQFVVDPKDVS